MGCCFFKRDKRDDDDKKADNRNKEMKTMNKPNNDIRIDT